MGMSTTEGQSSPNLSNKKENSPATETGSTSTTEVVPGLHLFGGEGEESASPVTSTEVVLGLHLFEDYLTSAEPDASAPKVSSASQFAEGEVIVMDDEASI